MRMNDKLKRKYLWPNEPEKSWNNARFKNFAQWGGGKTGNKGKTRTKKILKPTGFSGRTAGDMLRQYSQEKRK
jgi:hypothetical protein